MNAAKFFLLVMASAQLLADEPTPPPLPKGQAVGRFVIMAGRTESGEKLLRIDTATGKTWVWTELPVGRLAGAIKGWVEVPEDASALFWKANPEAGKPRATK